VLENSDTLPLRYADYQTEAIILDDMKSRSMILRNVKTDRKLKIEFEGFDYFLIWTQAKLKAPFVCLETWKGICDDPDTTHNIEVKRGIETIEKGGEFFASRSIEILN
jgi:galactose mutarotase-like enzyme